MHAQIVLFDGFDLLDVVGPFEVLHAGGTASRGALSVELVSADGPRDVPSGIPGTSLRATATLDPAGADLIVVPGASGPVSGDTPDSIPARLAAAAQSSLASQLQAALAKPGLTVATVCGGSLVLALAGLIAGRRAVTHHMGMEVLAAAGVQAIHARIVDDGDLVSAAGVTSGLDLGLYLLEREIGPRVAQAVESLFAHERRGTVWRATGAEAQPW